MLSANMRQLIHNAATSLINLATRQRHSRAGEVPQTFGKMGVLAGFGNPLLDVTVTIKDDKLLKKYNLNSDDQKEIPRECIAY